MCTKIYYCRKKEELVRLLCSYDKQISINAMKKLELPFQAGYKFSTALKLILTRTDK